MMTSRIRGAFLFATAMGAVACGGSSETAAPPQSGRRERRVRERTSRMVGQTLAGSARREGVVDVRRRAEGRRRRFSVTTGAATVSPSSAMTDSRGQAKTSSRSARRPAPS